MTKNKKLTVFIYLYLTYSLSASDNKCLSNLSSLEVLQLRKVSHKSVSSHSQKYFSTGKRRNKLDRIYANPPPCLRTWVINELEKSKRKDSFVTWTSALTFSQLPEKSLQIQLLDHQILEMTAKKKTKHQTKLQKNTATNKKIISQTCCCASIVTLSIVTRVTRVTVHIFPVT